MRQRSALAIFALLGLQAAAEARPRVGFANLTHESKGSRSAIKAARAEAGAAGDELVAPGPVRAALEDALPPPSSEAEDTLDEAIGLLAEAIDAYSESRYADVMDCAQKVDTLLTDLLPNTDTVRTLAEAQVLIGLVHVARDAPERAVESFRIVCRLTPDREELEADKYPIEAVELFQRAKRLEAKRNGVELSVATIPPGARVWVDGHAVGASPVSVKDVAPGIHYVAVGHEDLEPHAGKVWVEPGAGSRIELQPQQLSPPDRIRRIRRDALEAPAEEIAWARVAGALAAQVMVDVLILVRNGERGGFEAAFFDVRSVRLGAWIALPSPAFSRALQPSADGELLLDRMLAPNRRAPRPWYRTWWGTSLLVGGGMAIAGALVYGLSAGEDERSYTIGDWCFDGNPCP